METSLALSALLSQKHDIRSMRMPAVSGTTIGGVPWDSRPPYHDRPGGSGKGAGAGAHCGGVCSGGTGGINSGGGCNSGYGGNCSESVRVAVVISGQYVLATMRLWKILHWRIVCSVGNTIKKNDENTP